MFQSFADFGNPAQVAPRLAALRAKLRAEGIDGFIVPRADEHQGEYVAPPAERLSWLTGFTGSAGAAIILPDRAVLLVDGRYTLQAANQTDTALVGIGDGVALPVETWLERHAATGQRIGFDPWLHTTGQVDRLHQAARRKGFEAVAIPANPLDAVWADRPAFKVSRAVGHPESLAGEGSASKLTRIRAAIAHAGAGAAVLSDPASLAWLANMRGSDLPHLPVALGFALVLPEAPARFYLTAARPAPDLKANLEGIVEFRPRSRLPGDLAALARSGTAILLDPASCPEALRAMILQSGGSIVTARDPVVLPRAMKNATEIDGARAAHKRDGTAMVAFLSWLDRQKPGTITEIEAAKALEQSRVKTGKRLGMPLRDLSFDTIAGSGPHGAIVHYRVTESTNRTLGDCELFLIDSGGQYQDGTTDITRTVAIGTPTPAMRRHFTLVLKGMIAVSEARFPPGTRGVDLDILARRALWAAGLDYAHGTGHGVGSYLSVHEGPQSLSKRGMEPLQPGMILSNEPGYYSEGAYGIRIENLVIVQGAETPKDGDRAMHGFETLTLCPIDQRLIDTDLLDRDELRWIDCYHADVWMALEPLVPATTRAWLKRATRPLPRRRAGRK